MSRCATPLANAVCTLSRERPWRSRRHPFRRLAPRCTASASRRIERGEALLPGATRLQRLCAPAWELGHGTRRNWGKPAPESTFHQRERHVVDARRMSVDEQSGLCGSSGHLRAAARLSTFPGLSRRHRWRVEARRRIESANRPTATQPRTGTGQTHLIAHSEE